MLNKPHILTIKVFTVGDVPPPEAPHGAAQGEVFLDLGVGQGEVHGGVIPGWSWVPV